MDLFLVGLILLLASSMLSGIANVRARVVGVVGVAVVGCALTLVAAVAVLERGDTSSFHTTLVLPLAGLSLTLDPLGALFAAAASFVGLAALIYLIGYAKAELRSRTFLALYTIFILSLVVVPVASSVATFMFAWELMALASTVLILVEQRHRPEARAAAQWYAAMTQFGAASILLGLLWLSKGGSLNFSAIATHESTLSSGVRSVAFVLTFIGFASKAGAVPLHVWLPKAHPQAPSPVSALMSGVMVALGVYGVLRVGGVLLHGGELWWWVLVVVVGATSALYGALQAATSSDLKRLLAYSTIDVIGLVLTGVGCAGALRASGRTGDARLVLLGALLLLVAHAAFKACLFLAAGAVERSTGTRNLDHLGGLIHRLPFTTALFGVGALSIVAVPAFSGFSSEWVLLEGLLHGFSDRTTASLVVVLIAIAALALTGGLTAAAFVKAFGVGFLGRARSDGANAGREAALSMLVAMAVLALPSFLLGLVPGEVVPLVERAVATSGFGTRHSFAPGLSLVLPHERGAIEPAALLAGFVVAIFVVAMWTKRRGRQPRMVAAWRGGGDPPSARMQYTATSYGEPLQRVFSDVLRPELDVEVTHVDESRFYEETLSVQHRVDDVVERVVYQPIIAATRHVGVVARRVQNGSVHRYLAFGFVALLIVLVVLA
jgi:hydrogenase-4 component B